LPVKKEQEASKIVIACNTAHFRKIVAKKIVRETKKTSKVIKKLIQ
jgi:hypothetical protein